MMNENFWFHVISTQCFHGKTCHCFFQWLSFCSFMSWSTLCFEIVMYQHLLLWTLSFVWFAPWITLMFFSFSHARAQIYRWPNPPCRSNGHQKIGKSGAVVSGPVGGPAKRSTMAKPTSSSHRHSNPVLQATHHQRKPGWKPQKTPKMKPKEKPKKRP